MGFVVVKVLEVVVVATETVAVLVARESSVWIGFVVVKVLEVVVVATDTVAVLVARDSSV